MLNKSHESRLSTEAHKLHSFVFLNILKDVLNDVLFYKIVIFLWIGSKFATTETIRVSSHRFDHQFFLSLQNISFSILDLLRWEFIDTK